MGLTGFRYNHKLSEKIQYQVQRGRYTIPPDKILVLQLVIFVGNRESKTKREKKYQAQMLQ